MGLISRVSSRTYRRALMPPKIQKSKEAKAKAAMSSSKGKKKKWSKGKVRYKLVTASIASERMKVRASLAKQALRRLAAEGKITEVVKPSGQVLYTKIAPAEAPAQK